MASASPDPGSSGTDKPETSDEVEAVRSTAVAVLIHAGLVSVLLVLILVFPVLDDHYKLVGRDLPLITVIAINCYGIGLRHPILLIAAINSLLVLDGIIYFALRRYVSRSRSRDWNIFVILLLALVIVFVVVAVATAL